MGIIAIVLKPYSHKLLINHFELFRSGQFPTYQTVRKSDRIYRKLNIHGAGPGHMPVPLRHLHPIRIVPLPDTLILKPQAHMPHVTAPGQAHGNPLINSARLFYDSALSQFGSCHNKAHVRRAKYKLRIIIKIRVDLYAVNISGC